MSANLVARERGWSIRGWSEGEAATNEAFAPVETYEERLGEVLALARGLGFGVVDLWTAHLNPAWASEEHVRIARRLLERDGLRVATLAGGFGASQGELDRTCAVAAAVGAPILGGMLDADAREAWVAETLARHGLRLALENHPEERTPADVLARIGDGAGGRVGTTVDTGWWGTHGVDAVEAIRALRPYILHVHLKDVRRAGEHETCPWGEGVVPVEACVRELRSSGWAGAVSVEHEPERSDPSEAVGEMRAQLEGWLR